ncbi:MAG: septum formation protein Maf [Myxococcales bacterium]|nr:septum formation protein Maf [Myxococcales bacterium]
MLDRDHPLLLASGSPRRRDILTALGIPFVARAVDVDERPRPGEGAHPCLERVVQAKLGAAVSVARALTVGGVLVADTVVVLDGDALGKPADEAEARRMLARLAGREHVVLTRFALGLPGATDSPAAAQTVATRVLFRALSAAEIARYAASGEGLDKAGAYAIQGLGSFLVRSIAGSYTNVVGLPSAELCEALVATGLVPCFPLA